MSMQDDTHVEEALDYEEEEEEEEAFVSEGTAASPAAAAGGKSNGNAAADGNAAASEDPLSQPSHWCEVFVGGLPKAATLEQVKEFGSEVGEVVGVQFVKDPSNPDQHRGFGFIKYRTKVAAAKAMEQLSGKELAGHPGHKLRLMPSQSKHRLYVGHLPREMSKSEVEAEVGAATRGLESVELMTERHQPGSNRGFCFLEYVNHAAAVAAKRVLGDAAFRLGGKAVMVSFAEKQDDPRALAEVKSCHVSGLPPGASEEQLKELFSQFGEVTRVSIPGERAGARETSFGFVHFEARSQAVGCCEALETGAAGPLELDGKTLTVRMARPTATREQPGGGGGRGRGGGYDGGLDEGGYGGGGGGFEGYGGYTGFGYAAGGMAMVPMMLPNGQIGYMLTGAPAAGMVAAAGMGGVGPRRRGGAGGGGGRGYGGYGDDEYGGGRPRGRGGRGADRGGGGGGPRYRPY